MNSVPPAASGAPRYTHLITAEELLALRASGQPVAVFDCTFDLMNTGAGEALFLGGHIAGARYLHLDRDLSAAPGAEAASGGRHPLPTQHAFAATLRAHGLNAGTQVVAYDRQGVFSSGRLWWMLNWCGHSAVALLDGGQKAWEAAGGAVESGPVPTPTTPGNFEVAQSLAPTLGASDILQALGKPALTVVDARAGARYRGETEPLDAIAGHIPGALNRPFTDNFGPDGRFKPAEVLRDEFLRLLNGRDPATVVHHCGSGVTAVPNVLAMELAGLGRTALFPGSWSEWSRLPGVPCARG